MDHFFFEMHCFSLTTLLLCVTATSFVVGTEDNCRTKRQALLTSNKLIVGIFLPSCDENGNYRPLQINGSTGERWCVNVLTGEEIKGTRVDRTQRDPICSNEKCSSVRIKLMASNELIVGRYIPTCDASGNYKPLQRYGSTGERWCVDVITGKELPGSRVRPTQPDPVCF